MKGLHSANHLLSLASETPHSFCNRSIVEDADSIDTEILSAPFFKRLPCNVRLRLRQRHVYEPFCFRFNGNTYKASRDDCSEVVWMIARALKEAGASRTEILAHTQNTIFWKDRVRRRKNEDPVRFITRLFEDTPPPDDSKVVWFDPSEWAGTSIPERKWLVKDLIALKKATGLYGDGGTGKTTIAMQLMVSVALDLPFLGMKVASGTAMGFLAENDSEDTQISLGAILQQYGASFEQLRGRMLVASRAGFDNMLMAFTRGNRGLATVLFNQILDEIRIARPILIVFDTAADLFGGNENDRLQVRQFVSECCGKIALEMEAAVVVCAHPSQSGLRTGDGTAGSTGWSNTFRGRLYLRRDIDRDGEADVDIRILELRKANFSQVGQWMKLRWYAGAFIRDDDSIIPKPLSKIDNQIVDQVRYAFDAGEPWSAHTQAKSRWLGLWIIDNLSMKRHAAGAAINRLLFKKKIKNIKYDLHNHLSGLCTPEQAEIWRAKQKR